MKPELRKLVYDKYNGCCAYCGCEMTFKEMQVDHLVSKLIFSLKSNKIYTDKDLNDIDNLMPSCRVCNKWKSAHSLEQFRKEISQQLKRLNEYNANFRFAKKYGLIQETPKDIIFHFEKK
jgi:5-methylcytosine-specific restriction endonuclease McrA